MNYDTEERNKNENPDHDDLRRFLRGGFGAKWAHGILVYEIENMRQFFPE